MAAARFWTAVSSRVVAPVVSDVAMMNLLGRPSNRSERRKARLLVRHVLFDLMKICHDAVPPKSKIP